MKSMFALRSVIYIYSFNTFISRLTFYKKNITTIHLYATTLHSYSYFLYELLKKKVYNGKCSSSIELILGAFVNLPVIKEKNCVRYFTELVLGSFGKNHLLTRHFVLAILLS